MPTHTAETSYIDLNKIDNPQDARTHSPDKLNELAADMTAQGQLQEIVVVPKGDRYEVLAGAGRLQAARKLGWAQIRASVRQVETEFERTRITYAENQDREDVDPFYQASLIQKMLDAKGGSRRELGEELGISDSLIDAYVAICKLPDAIKEIPKRLGIGSLLQITRLNDPNEQIRLNKQALDQDLSVRQLKALVDKALGKTSSAPRPQRYTPDTADPLGEVWGKLKGSPSSYASWQVTYPKHETWVFEVHPNGGAYASLLAECFREIAKGLDANDPIDHFTEPPSVSELPPSKPKVLEADDAAFTNPRLPSTPAEEAELATAAQNGPSAFYDWIYGQANPYSQQVEGKTWQDVAGVSDPKAAMKLLLDGFKMMLGK